ncbi:MAG: beta-galactosidase, partial [bacterium]
HMNKNVDERLLIGASWYPEMWPAVEWSQDIARMKELGFNIVRLLEFAWHRLEPVEGEYDFAWALQILDLCHAANIAVMVGTPTAAPPAWLTEKYPEVLQTHANGKRATHGMRKHYSVYSTVYREKCADIVRAMVKAFGNHPAIHSWQIDNEMGGSDYGTEAQRGFHTWLQRKYGTVENLNGAWGLEFWSQAYSDFRQIPMSTASVGSIEIPERHHPSLIMAISRYNNDAWTDFIRNQCHVIREVSEKPITTNMTPGFGMNWYQHNHALDRVGHSLYRDVDHYHWNAMYFDRMRAEKPAPYWQLETAPSWSAGGKIWNIHHDARGIRAFTWLMMLMGGSMIIYWQWREHWAGQEMLHGTLVTATGKWRPNKEAMKQLSKEFEAHSEWLLAHPPVSAQVGLLQSNEAAWAFSIDPTDENMGYDARWRDDYHVPLVQHHIWRDVINEEHDFSQYKVLIIPLMPILKKSTRARLRQWVAEGGRLLLGPLTGFRTDEFTAFTRQEFGGLEELIGAVSALRFPAHWQENCITVDNIDGTSTRTRAWCEAYEPVEGTAVANYHGGYGDGLPAMIENSFGKGKVITLGCMVDEKTYISQVMRLLNEVGIAPVAAGSADVVVIPREDGYGVVNLKEEERTVTLPSTGINLFTGKTVGPELSLQSLETMLIKIA